VVGNLKNIKMGEHGAFSTFGCSAGVETKSHIFGTLRDDWHHGRDV
jgi:hypothetical protein